MKKHSISALYSVSTPAHPFLQPKIPDVRAHASADTKKYTCPMHPQIIKDAPGNCPICGMTLVPMNASEATNEDRAELRMMSKRFWISLPLTAIVFVLAMGHVLPDLLPNSLSMASALL